MNVLTVITDVHFYGNNDILDLMFCCISDSGDLFNVVARC